VVNIVVVQADEQKFGLVVDGISDTEEIVVKPLGKELKQLAVFAGATIMGDGHVALIIDVLGLARRAHVVSPTRERMLEERPVSAPTSGARREPMLVFRARGDARMAIPLALVSRLEEIAPARVERAAGREVVQYRGGVMPLLWLVDDRSRATRMTREQPLHVVVFTENGRSVGLVVDEISDVIEEEVHVQAQAGSADLLGIAVLAGRVTDLLDVRRLIERQEPGFFERRGAAA